MKGHFRPVSNHRRKSIDKTHKTSNLQSLEEKVSRIKSYLHNKKPSISIGFKNLGRGPFIFPIKW